MVARGTRQAASRARRLAITVLITVCVAPEFGFSCGGNGGIEDPFKGGGDAEVGEGGGGPKPPARNPNKKPGWGEPGWESDWRRDFNNGP